MPFAPLPAPERRPRPLPARKITAGFAWTRPGHYSTFNGPFNAVAAAGRTIVFMLKTEKGRRSAPLFSLETKRPGGGCSPMPFIEYLSVRRPGGHAGLPAPQVNCGLLPLRGGGRPGRQRHIPFGPPSWRTVALRTSALTLARLRARLRAASPLEAQATAALRLASRHWRPKGFNPFGNPDGEEPRPREITNRTCPEP